MKIKYWLTVSILTLGAGYKAGADPMFVSRMFDLAFFEMRKTGDGLLLTFCWNRISGDSCEQQPRLVVDAKKQKDFFAEVRSQCDGLWFASRRQACQDWVESLPAQVDHGAKAWEGWQLWVVDRVVTIQQK